jgi:predicted alpha/beta hydrolase
LSPIFGIASDGVPVSLRFAGYFPGRKLRRVGDLPYGVTEQWRQWCLSLDYLGAEAEPVRSEVARVGMPITAFSIEDDEMMTLAGTRALFGLYRNADVTVERIRPSEHGLPSIGHFGFFRPKMQAALWPMVPAWIDRVS